MKAPLSWIKDYVDLDDLTVEEIANRLTMVGLEVENITLVGLETPAGNHLENKYEGLPWPRDKFVVAEVIEVNPHPNADKLTLCELNDGTGVKTILTGAPNMFRYLGKGPLTTPMKVAYAREGAQLYDGHQPGLVLTRLKRAVIRGVESSSMICSEKELGISEEHEGIIELDDDAPVGMPLVDYMGDAVFDIAILPNMARDASIIAIARELAAACRRELRVPVGIELLPGGEIQEKVALEVRDPELNPRFMLGMLEGVEANKSPYWVQRRLALAGMRPIDALVDATNYTMLDTGQPLHAFDYDQLRQRADGIPTIITRTALPGEKIITLDGTEHNLDSEVELVSDTKGALSIAGVMGGGETGITSHTKSVLIEAASWNFINIRKTLGKVRINSEASYRFSRNVHPALAELALALCLQRMQAWAGGRVVGGVLDAYGKPFEDTVNTLSSTHIEALLGMAIPMAEVVDILTRLGFKTALEGEVITAVTPPTRTDIETGLIGQANLVEEISRIYGYDRIPARRLADELPPQVANTQLEAEETMRDLLVNTGLQDTVAYRQTSPGRENRIYPGNNASGAVDYVRIKNPITPERTVMRRSSLATMLEMLEYNAKLRPGLALFELGPVFLPVEAQLLPDEKPRLTIGLSGQWELSTWDRHAGQDMDFFDLKGIVESLLQGLHIEDVTFAKGAHPSFHPGKCAEVLIGDVAIGALGEIHPLVRQNYDFSDSPVLAAELDVERLIEFRRTDFTNIPVPTFPSMVEDIALIVDETVTSAQLEKAIRQTGGKLLVGARLFDIYRGEKLGEGKKSMAYQLTYQAYDRTLTDKDAETIRNRVVRALGKDFGAVLRSR